MATTYVFGAGASLHVGYPLASNMGKGLLDYMHGSTDGAINEAGNFFAEFFPGIANIEDLLSEIQSRIDSSIPNGDIHSRCTRALLAQYKGTLGDALRGWFREIRENPAMEYAIFAKDFVQPGDTIITFNYDDSLERELARVGKWDVSAGYGFEIGGLRGESAVRVLKLHGSTNWLVSICGGQTGTFAVSDSLGNHPLIAQQDLEYLGCAGFAGRIFGGGAAFPCLVLPTRTKTFFYETSFGNEFSDFWAVLWLQATDAVRKSRQIIVCGYSLLAIDERARTMLLNDADKSAEIEIVSGNQTGRIVADFTEAGFHRVSGHEGGYFGDWLKENSVHG